MIPSETTRLGEHEKVESGLRGLRARCRPVGGCGGNCFARSGGRSRWRLCLERLRSPERNPE